MKMYHISLDIFKNIEVFVPRIPQSRLKNEDSITPRVCVSNSLENCLMGMTYMAKYWKCLTDDSGTNFDLFDGDDVCLRLLKVYEFEIEDNLIAPEELDGKKLVPDAIKTNEYWSLKEIIPTKSYVIKMKDLVEDCNSFKILSVEYDFVDISTVPRTAEVHFHKVDDDVKMLFGTGDCSLCYDILQTSCNTVYISLENYLSEKDDLLKIFDRYFSWTDNYIKTVML